MRHRHPTLTGALTLLTLAIAPFSGLGEALQLDRTTVAYQPWRLVTGQFTHWTSSHLLWDLAAFCLLGSLLERRSRATFLATLAVASILISATVLAFQSHLATYRGLSGVDAALAIAVALQVAREAAGRRDRLQACGAGALALALVVKITVECATGRMLFVAPDPAFQPVPLAHLAGALAGLAVSGTYSIRAKAAQLTAA